MFLNDFDKRNQKEKMDLKLKLTENDCFDYLIEFKDKFSDHTNSAYCSCCQLSNIIKCIYDCNLKSLCDMRLRIFHLSESDIEFSSLHHGHSSRL